MKFYNEILDYITKKDYPFKILSEKSFAFVYQNKAFIIMQDEELPDYTLRLIMPKVYTYTMKDRLIRNIADGISNGFNRFTPLIKTIVADEEVYLSVYLVDNPDKVIFESFLHKCLDIMIDTAPIFANKMEFMIEEDIKYKTTPDKEKLLDMVYDFTSHN